MILVIGLIILVALLIYGGLMYDKGTNRIRLESKEKYEEAIRSGNKQKALELGRKYYASLRFNGRPTIYDEQAITNDLSTMGK